MKTNKGVTLIALIITVIILSILASIIVVTSTQSIDYTKENKFIAEIKVIREKVNIINKEISLGSYAYDDIGKDISTLSTELKTTIQHVFNKCGVQEAYQSNYKYFDFIELEKIGVYNFSNNVLIDFNSMDIISIEGVTKNGITYHTIRDLEKQ